MKEKKFNSPNYRVISDRDFAKVLGSQACLSKFSIDDNPFDPDNHPTLYWQWFDGFCESLVDDMVDEAAEYIFV